MNIQNVIINILDLATIVTALMAIGVIIFLKYPRKDNTFSRSIKHKK